MSSASPHSPNSGSSSRCQPTHDRHPRQRFRLAAVGTSPSAHQGFIRGAIALQIPASSGQHRFPVWPNSGALPVRIRTSARGITRDRPRCVVRPPSLPSVQLRQGKKKGSPLGGHHGTTIPQTYLFSPQVSSPTCSE